MAHHVFISYASRDKPVGETVCAVLESKGIICWIAPRDILPGTEWAEAIVDAIDSSRALVLVLSVASNGSPQVIREVSRAAGRDIPIVALRIDDVPLSKSMDFFISSHHWFDAYTPPLEKHLERLADIIHRLLAQQTEAEVVEAVVPVEDLAISVKAPAPLERVKAKPLRKQPWLWAVIAAFMMGLGALFIFLPPLFQSGPPPPSPAPIPPPAPTTEPAPAPVPGSQIILKYETFLTDTSRLVAADTWFFDEVARLSGGLVEIEYNYGQPHSATTSPLLGDVSDGSIDCGLIPLAAIPDLIPMSQALHLTYLTDKPDSLAKAAKTVYDDFIPLREEWEVQNNAKVLYFLPVDTTILCSTTPVTCVSDLSRLKIRSYGLLTDSVDRLGADPVVISSIDLYPAFQAGAIDGALVTAEGISELGLFEPARYLTETGIGPYGVYATVIKRNTWDSLPSSVQDLMEDLSNDAVTRYLRLLEEYNLQAAAKMEAAGVRIYLWSAAERELARNLVQPMQSRAWAEGFGPDGLNLVTRLEKELASNKPQSTYKSFFEIWMERYGK